jgi:hypothetical protein
MGANHSIRKNSAGKYIVDFSGELKIEIAETLDAVSIQIDDDFVVDVGPIGVMVHGLREESNLSHFAEGGDEILAGKFAMQFAIRQSPALQGRKVLLHFIVGEFFGLHGKPPGAPAPLCVA